MQGSMQAKRDRMVNSSQNWKCHVHLQITAVFRCLQRMHGMKIGSTTHIWHRWCHASNLDMEDAIYKISHVECTGHHYISQVIVRHALCTLAIGVPDSFPFHWLNISVDDRSHFLASAGLSASRSLQDTDAISRQHFQQQNNQTHQPNGRRDTMCYLPAAWLF